MFLHDARSVSTRTDAVKLTSLKLPSLRTIPSEQVPFCLDKLITEAIPLLEEPPVVCLVHLYKLLCGVTFDRSHIFKCCNSQGVVKAGNSKKNLMDYCVRSFVSDTPVECSVWPRTAANFGPRTGLRFDLPLNRPPFLGEYDELHNVDIPLLLN
jgi:hypothetical protein